MRKFPQIGLALATAIALAGCQASAIGQVALQPGTKPGATTPATNPAVTPGNPTTGGQAGMQKPPTGGNIAAAKPPVAVGKVPAAQAQASVTAGQETASALAEEREMEDYGTLADQEGGASYELFQLGNIMDAAEKARRAAEEARRAGLQAGANGTVAGSAGIKAGDAGLKAGEAGMKAGEAGLKAGEAGLKAGEGAVRAGAIMRGELKANEKAQIERLNMKSKELREKAAKLTVKAEVLANVAERQGKRGEKLAGRLDKMKDAREKIRGAMSKANWVDNGDGTATRTLDFSVTKTLNGKTFERSSKIVRTRRIEGKVLLLATAEFSQALPGGLTRTSTRSKALNADGTYSIEFKSVITLPNGSTRVASWEKTVGVEGGVTGTGTIIWTAADGTVKKTVTISLSGDEDTPKADCEDTATGGEAKVTVAEDGSIEATIGDDEAGTAEEVVIATSADGSVEVSTGDTSVSVGADGTIVVESGDDSVSTDGNTTVVTDGDSMVSTDGETMVKADAAATAAVSTN